MSIPIVRTRHDNGSTLPWTSTSVTMECESQEGLFDELFERYVDPLSRLRLDAGATNSVVVEADWDGCGGRWASLDFTAEGVTVAVCAWLFLDPTGSSLPAASVRRASENFARAGWTLVETGDWADPSGFWTKDLPLRENRIGAEDTMTAALAVFGETDFEHWYVTVTYNDDWVDLRAWNRSLGYATPPPTIAPLGTEMWRILCDDGEHESHEPPCVSLDERLQ